MIAKYEKIHFMNDTKIWYCKYYDLKNMVHWHKEIELIYINKGTLKVGVNNKTFYATEGGLVICNSGDIHFLDSESQNSSVNILILNESIAKDILASFSPLIPYLQKDELEKNNISVKGLFSLISRELIKKEDFYTEVVNAHIIEFLAKCYRCFKDKNAFSNSKNHNKNILKDYRKLTEHIDTHYSEIDFKKACEFMHFSPSHFSKIFSSISGMPFTEYLNFVRVEKAIEMIKAKDTSITHIAIECGFDSIRHFNRVFKELTNTTPSQVTKDFMLNNFIHPQYSYKEGFNPNIHHSKLIRMF